MVLRDRRNKAYYYMNYYWCPACHKTFAIRMEFNNGRTFIADDIEEIKCKICGNDKPEKISEFDFNLTRFELEYNS